MNSLLKSLFVSGAVASSILTSPVEALSDRGIFHPFRDSFFTGQSLERMISNHGLSMYEKEGKLVIEAPVPGIDESNIEITLEKGILTINGIRKRDESKETKYYYHSSNQFTYSLALPEMVDESNPEATLNNGLMQITFDMKEESQPRKIEIR